MPKYERIKKMCSLAVLGNNAFNKQDDNIQNSNFRLPSNCKEYENIPIDQTNSKIDVISTIETAEIIENDNPQFKNNKDNAELANKKHNKDAILPVDQSTEILKIPLEEHKLYEDKNMLVAVSNIENIFENENFHLDEVNEDIPYLSPTHLQPDFVEMRNVTPTRLPNEYLNVQSQNNNNTIPPVEEHNQFSVQLEKDSIIEGEEISTAAVNYLENNPQNSNFQLEEVTEDEIIEPPPAKKKRIRDPQDRIKAKKDKHPMGTPCQDKCIRKCTVNINEEQRQIIWDNYWNLDIQRRRDFISRNVENNRIAIRYSNSTKRNHTYTYRLLNHRVCKTMFLRTLGYTNDQAVVAVLKANFKMSKTPDSAKISAAPDLRGRHKPKHSFSDEYLNEIDSFIELFHPASSHYRLEHAPNRRYLPTGLTLTQMFQFLKKHLERQNKQPCSWSAFHKRIKIKNISTQQPVQDKCPKCEAHDVAHPKPRLPRDENVTDHLCHECNCEFCILFPQHLENKNISRAHMNADSKDAEKMNSGIAIFTVDMQKCITMPQLNNKDFFFSRKLNLFNETFAGIGKGNKPATAMLWHEGESGRKAYDVATAYVLFLKMYCRDDKTVILYADNCNAQNKNKILYSALLRIINDCSNDIQTIKIEYLEPGHTYMSADSVHGAITNKINKSGNLYDLDDYVETFKKPRKNLTPHVHDHKEVMLFTSELKTVFPRNYNISNFKIVEFRRGQPKLFVKNNYQADDFKELDVLTKALKKEIMNTVGKEVDMFKNVARRTEAEGISKKKKDDLIKLLKFMPKSRHKFYENLLVNENITQDLDESASEIFT
uniref:DUF7869 domain-containing protein n=1 Tax=Heliothis virescens TaxID=7102 RepID=A0A2A4J600_HELVI